MSTEYPITPTFFSEQGDLFVQDQQQVVPQGQAFPLHYCLRSQGEVMPMDLCQDLCLFVQVSYYVLCMCVCVCVCIYVCVCVYACVCMCVSVYVCVFMYRCMYAYVQIQ